MAYIHVASRVMTLLLLFAGTFCFGILPIFVRRNLMTCECVGPTCKKSCRARRGKIISTLLIYFGGGVLLATCMIHLLPEGREGINDYFDSRNKDEQGNSSGIPRDVHFADDGGVPNDVINHTKDIKDEEKHEHGEEFPIPEFIVCCGFFAVYLLEETLQFFLGGHTHIPTETRAIRSLSRSNSCVVPCPGDPAPPSSPSQGKEQGMDSIVITPGEQQHGHSHSFPMGFSLSGLLTVVALSFHSVFEGFAIGLQETDKGIWILFGAISVHKFVIAFVVGLEVLASGGREMLLYIYMGVFSAMSPIGMAAAIITQTNIEETENGSLIEGVLNSIATGTLLYVTFFEILHRDEDEKVNVKGWQQFLATFLGFGVMCLVQYLSTLA